MNFRGVAAASLLAAFGCADAVATPNQDLLLFNGSHFVGATVDMNFATGQYFGLSPSQLTVSRASTEYEVCNGTLYGPFAANALAITPCGAWIWEARTNLFLNNNAPATQTVAVTSGGYYSVSFYGAGTLTLSGACATTMTGTAFPARTMYSCQASTTSLTTTVTTLGTMQLPQVEANPNANSVGTSFASGPIPTAGSAVTRAATSAVAVTANCPNPSLYTYGASYGINTNNIEYLAWYGTGTSNILTTGYGNTTGNLFIASNTSSVSWGFTGSAGVNGVYHKLAVTQINVNLTGSIDGVLQGPHSFGAALVVSPSWIYLGQNPYAGNYLNGPLARLALGCGVSLNGR